MSQSHLSKLHEHQKKNPIASQFYKLRILKMIHDFYACEIAQLMHQHSNQILPACFSTLFTNLSSIHTRQTRSITIKNLYLLNALHPVVKNLLNFKDQKFWNSIPVNLRKMTFSNFKKKYLQKLLESFH